MCWSSLRIQVCPNKMIHPTLNFMSIFSKWVGSTTNYPKNPDPSRTYFFSRTPKNLANKQVQTPVLEGPSWFYALTDHFLTGMRWAPTILIKWIQMELYMHSRYEIFMGGSMPYAMSARNFSYMFIYALTLWIGGHVFLQEQVLSKRDPWDLT